MSTPTVSNPSIAQDEPFDSFVAAVRAHIAPATGPFFQTDATPEALWHTYLSGVPGDRRQHYTCSACRRFIGQFGGLVTIDEAGETRPLLWGATVPDFYAPSAGALRGLVSKANVTGVFLSSQPAWGTPTAGGWEHLSCPSPAMFPHAVTSAAQAMAERLADFQMLSRGLAEYPRAAVDQALRVLRSDKLDRSEKALGVAEWFAALHAAVAAHPKRRANLVWRAVATAPVGYCHVRSTMIATLLDDVVAGLKYADLAARWAAKMHPLRYQRPQAAPSAGAIEQAERLVEKLGLAPSLRRRFATLGDVLAKVWTPTPVGRSATEPTGVFGHLRPGNKPAVPAVDLPTTDITWEKFARTVLPRATALQVLLPARGSFYGLLTADDASAPPILQWDGLPGRPRNPASWYFYHGGSAPTEWKLSPGWTDVSAVFLAPHQWQEPSGFSHHTPGVCFAVPGCQDTRDPGLALFPEFVRSELHGIRAVIEAHSNSRKPADPAVGTANGLAFHKGSSAVAVRATTGDGVATYKVDRLD